MRTGIIATYGPALQDEETLLKALKLADIIRINFSHETLESRIDAIKRVRAASKKIKKRIKILADLPGPKIRISLMANDVNIVKGGRVVFCYVKDAKNGEIPTDVDIYDDVRAGSQVFIGDGSPSLMIEKLSNRRIICRALYDGVIKGRKGINVKHSRMSATPPTSDDMRFAAAAKAAGADMIALSFVSSPEDIRKMRKITGTLPIISKIERVEGIENIIEITRESEMILVARGDLALNVDMWTVPMIQDHIVKTCRRLHKPVIVATEMLSSMSRSPTPTRAELTDVSNAEKSGADYTMLSDETSIGKYPIESIQMMRNILDYTHKYFPKNKH